MGASMSKARCGACLGGLWGPRPRGARRRGSDKVATIEEALRLGRRQEGSWQPSPKAALGSPPHRWTSPVPDDAEHAAFSGGIELVIEDFDSDSLRQGALPRGGPDAAPPRRSKYEVEQLCASPGSLPRPMLADEREAAIRALQPTATFEMLARVPRDFLESQQEEAQVLRRKLVRGATVVFVSAGYPGKRFIFERAAALGVKSVIIDHPDSWSRGLVDEGLAAKFLPVDMGQASDEVYRQAERLVLGLGGDGLTGAADAVTTFVELAVPLAARLCEALGLPGFRPGAVDAARDKHKTRLALKAAGLPTPRNVLIKTEAGLRAAGEFVGFPAVLKPVSGAASLGVKKVESMEHLEARYREVTRELSSLVVASGALAQDDGSGGVDASKVVDLTVLLEQYLDGQEVDVDIVMSDGHWRYAAVSDNGPTIEPYFNETWGISPSLLPREQQAALQDLAIRSVEALGFTSGVFHVECKYTSTGPQLIEVNARMGGGPICEVNRLVWGVDMVEEALFIALGIPARPPCPPKPRTCVGYNMVNAKRSGKLRSTACIEELRKLDGVLAAEPIVKPGGTVVGPSEGLPTWVCMLVVSRSTAEEALAYVQQLEAGLALEIE